MPPLPHYAAHLLPQRELAPFFARTTDLRSCTRGCASCGALRHRQLERLFIVAAVLCALASGCGAEDATLGNLNHDGSFGTPADPSRDGGLDASASLRDDATVNAPSVRVRFVHAIPNLGALLVCHDPDGPGPVSADVLREDTELLRADYGTRSNTLLVPVLSTGELTLQRDSTRPVSDGGLDAGLQWGDAGSPLGPCDMSYREATIPLPITGGWLAPSAPVSDDQLSALGLLPSLAGATALTLLGSGVALNESVLDQRAAAARDSWLKANPGDTDRADQAGMLERAGLQATFGARALIQTDLAPSDAQTFRLSVFHAIPDVPPADSSRADREIGAVRLCVTAAMRDSGVLPKPPAAGVPFRLRTAVGDSFVAGLNYDFRVFAEGAFDAKDQDCSTTSLLPLAKASFSSFVAGHAYTLALFGVVAPVALCSPNDVSIARASCSRPASELGAHIELLVD